MIQVEKDGQIYQEMHVDGGASTPFFVAPDALREIDTLSNSQRGANIYCDYQRSGRVRPAHHVKQTRSTSPPAHSPACSIISRVTQLRRPKRLPRTAA
jgi:hypothetical protein